MVTAYHVSDVLSISVIISLSEERMSFCWPLTYYVVTAYHVSSVLSISVIILLSEEADGRFVGHLLILW